MASGLARHTSYNQSCAQTSLIYNAQHSTCYFKWPTKDLPWWHEHYLQKSLQNALVDMKDQVLEQLPPYMKTND